MLEICVDDWDGLEAAIAGGADRVELCSALGLGGLTPSAAFAERACAANIPIHAMVRPRAGNFLYSDGETELILREIANFRSIGVSGVVVGATVEDGNPDIAALGRYRDAAKDMQLTWHRAIDLAADPVGAVEIAKSLGYDVILTSGGALHAADGATTIAVMVDVAGATLKIMAGSGISASNAAAVMQATGVAQLHASASDVEDWGDPRLEDFGFVSGARRKTSATKVAAIKRAMMEGGAA